MLFVAGFFLSLLGSLPPGLISLTVAQTTIHRGVVAALILGAGAAIAEFFQAWLAAEAAGWFLRYPLVEQGLHWAAVPVFVGLGGYLILKPISPRAPADQPERSENLFRYFRKGLMVSLFNLLAIPYWLTYCAWLRTTDWWKESLFSTALFSAGVTVGTFAALAAYASIGHFAVQRSKSVSKWANKVVGTIFLGLGLKILAGMVF